MTAFFFLFWIKSKKRLRVWEHTTDNPTGFPSGERLRVWEHLSGISRLFTLYKYTTFITSRSTAYIFQGMCVILGYLVNTFSSVNPTCMNKSLTKSLSIEGLFFMGLCPYNCEVYLLTGNKCIYRISYEVS